LNIVNEGGVADIREAIERGRAGHKTGTGPFTYGLFSKKFSCSMEPLTKTKFKAPKPFRPPSFAPLEGTIAGFGRIAAALRKLAMESNGLHLAKVKTFLPVLPPPLRYFLRMSLGARFQLI